MPTEEAWLCGLTGRGPVPGGQDRVHGLRDVGTGPIGNRPDHSGLLRQLHPRCTHTAFVVVDWRYCSPPLVLTVLLAKFRLRAMLYSKRALSDPELAGYLEISQWLPLLNPSNPHANLPTVSELEERFKPLVPRHVALRAVRHDVGQCAPVAITNLRPNNCRRSSSLAMRTSHRPRGGRSR
jgi:hypothetical protein